VWLDVDPAVMRGGHEPDDGVAMVQAFHSPEVEVVGISVVFGNAPLETGHRIARRVAAEYGPPDLPVHRGAASPAAGPTPASRALSAALRERRLTVFVLGPATNLAEVLGQDPGLASRLESVVMVIGRQPGEPLTFPGGGPNLVDFNFELDPEAAERVLASGAPVTLVPFEFAARLPVAEADWASLWDTPFARVFRGPIEDYLDWFEANYGRRATYPFDSYAVASVVAPHLLGCSPETVRIESGPADGDGDEGDSKPWLVLAEEGWPVTWCHTPDPGLREDLLRRLRAP